MKSVKVKGHQENQSFKVSRLGTESSLQTDEWNTITNLLKKAIPEWGKADEQDGFEYNLPISFN